MQHGVQYSTVAEIFFYLFRPKSLLTHCTILHMHYFAHDLKTWYNWFISNRSVFLAFSFVYTKLDLLFLLFFFLLLLFCWLPLDHSDTLQVRTYIILLERACQMMIERVREKKTQQQAYDACMESERVRWERHYCFYVCRALLWLCDCIISASCGCLTIVRCACIFGLCLCVCVCVWWFCVSMYWFFTLWLSFRRIAI